MANLIERLLGKNHTPITMDNGEADAPGVDRLAPLGAAPGAALATGPGAR